VELSVQACDINDSCLKDLTQLKGLRKLFINSTEVSIDGVRKLGALENLEELWVGSSVNAESVEFRHRVLDELKQCKKLTTLWLMGIKLPPQQLHTQIAQLKSLRHILFSTCNVDTRTLDRIRTHNPALRVDVID